jgi:hypothetical protein
MRSIASVSKALFLLAFWFDEAIVDENQPINFRRNSSEFDPPPRSDFRLTLKLFTGTASMKRAPLSRKKCRLLRGRP